VKRGIWRFGFFGLVLALLLVLSCAWALAAARDATSFDPLPVTIQAQTQGSGVPVGTIISWPSASHPADAANWLECNGQAITQAAYPELYAVVGAAVPDYRGMFLRGVGGKSATLGQKQAGGIDASAPFNLTLQAREAIMPIAPEYYGTTEGMESTVVGHGYSPYSVLSHRPSGYTPATSELRHSVRFIKDDPSCKDLFCAGHWEWTDSPSTTIQAMIDSGLDETRPDNIAVRYLIRARP
jgi:hypothetical protein